MFKSSNFGHKILAFLAIVLVLNGQLIAFPAHGGIYTQTVTSRRQISPQDHHDHQHIVFDGPNEEVVLKLNFQFDKPLKHFRIAQLNYENEEPSQEEIIQETKIVKAWNQKVNQVHKTVVNTQETKVKNDEVLSDDNDSKSKLETVKFIPQVIEKQANFLFNPVEAKIEVNKKKTGNKKQLQIEEDSEQKVLDRHWTTKVQDKQDSSSPSSSEGTPAPSSSEGTPAPSAEGTTAPSAEGTPAPSAEGGAAPSAEEGTAPSAEGTPAPSAEGTPAPSAEGTPAPSAEEGAAPSAEGGAVPSAEGGAAPSAEGGAVPSAEGGAVPSAEGGALSIEGP